MRFRREDNAIVRLGRVLLPALLGFYVAEIVCYSVLIWTWPRPQF